MNPYPSEFALLFWHDLYKRELETMRADWREQSGWVNENVPALRTGEALGRPWLAIVEAYQSALAEIERLKTEAVNV